MLLYFVATLLLCSVNARSLVARTEANVSPLAEEDYRLPNNVVPLRYQMELAPDFVTDTFRGSSNITLSVVASGNDVTLHALDLEIEASVISLLDTNGNSVNSVSGISYSNDDRQFFTISFEETLDEGSTYTLVIATFTGVLNNDNNGFYLAKYTNEAGVERKLAATDFVATFARRAFPCFDEPALKAEFEISVIRPADYDSNTNTPKMSTEQLPDGRYRDMFQRTPRMSTYIVVVVVSDFVYVARQNQRVFGRPEVIAAGSGDYALSVAQPMIDIIEAYLGIPYTLPKMDQVGIPNGYFRWSAMENWGCVTYREDSLMFLPTQTIAELVAHEFGHQWFGNLVTLSWWSYVWLNEGFATYIQYRAAAIQQDYNFATRIVTAITQNVLRVDSSTTTRPLNQGAITPEDLIDLFDTIAYYKGASVIRMMEGILSSPVFRRGLNIYINRMQFNNSQPSDLYASWQEALNESNSDPFPEGEDVESVMTTWDSNAGYPLLTVTRNYTDGSVTFSQRRFLTSNPDNDYESIWYVPISYATQSNADFSEPTPRVWLTTRENSNNLVDLQANDWIVVNIQQSGYYRANYDNDNWYRIIDFLDSNDIDGIHPVNRAQLIDDAYELARYGVIDYDIALGLTRYLVRETKYGPLQSFVNALAFLDSQLAGTNAYDKFKAYVLEILETAYKSIELEENEKDNIIIKLNRQNIIKWMCSYGYKDCEDYARQKLRDWQQSESNRLSSHLQVPLICTALKLGDPSDWEFVFQKYMVEKNPILRANLTTSLGCSENRTVLNRYLTAMLNPGDNITSSERLAALSSIYESGDYGKTYMNDYIIDNWSVLQKRLSSAELSSIIDGIAPKLSTKKQLVEMEHLALENPSIFKAGINALKSNVIWAEKYLSTITRWLNKTY